MKYKNSNNEWKTIKVKNYGIEQTPIGSMVYYPSQVIPNGYLVCDGREILIADFPLLFNAIGYIGGTDVSTGYFRLPDMQGIVPAGYNPNLVGTTNPLAGTFGDKVGSGMHVLTIDEIPKHKHNTTLTSGGTVGAGGAYDYAARMHSGTNIDNVTFFTNEAGGSQPHSSVQPTRLYHWLIKAKNVITLGGYTEDFEVTGNLNILGKLNIKNNNQVITYNNDYTGNCDDITETSTVWVHGGTNYPPQIIAGAYGYLTTIKASDSYISQTFIDANDNNLYTRLKINGIWTAWQWVNSKNILTIKADNNQTIPTADWTQVVFPSIFQRNGNQLHLLNNGIQIGYGIKKVKVGCNIWAQTTSGYSWVTLKRLRPSTHGYLEIAHNIIGANHTEGYRSHSISSTIIDVAMGDIIEASIKFSGASQYNSLNGGDYYGSVQLTVEEV